MTSPSMDFRMSAFTLEGADNTNMNCRITSGTGRSSEAVDLPVGENMIRVTALGSPESLVRVVVVRGKVNTMLGEWQKVGASGVVLQAPNDTEGAWMALRTNTPGVVFGLTIFNTPPKS